MSGTYENIAPTITLRGINAENLVNTVAFDRIPNGNIMKRNYIGSGDVWSGSDLSIVKHGDGKIILSTLKLIQNLSHLITVTLLHIHHLLSYYVEQI